MEHINLIFKGPFLIIKGPEQFIDIVKEHVMEILNDFAETQEMPLYKACQKLIDNEKTQSEFKLMVSLYTLFNL